MVIPFFEVGYRMIGKEFRRHPLVGYFPCRCLGAILTELENPRIRRFCPRATHTHEPIGFVLLQQYARTTEGNAVAPQALQKGFDRAPPPGGACERLDREVRP